MDCGNCVYAVIYVDGCWDAGAAGEGVSVRVRKASVRGVWVWVWVWQVKVGMDGVDRVERRNVRVERGCMAGLRRDVWREDCGQLIRDGETQPCSMMLFAGDGRGVLLLYSLTKRTKTTTTHRNWPLQKRLSSEGSVQLTPVKKSLRTLMR